MTRMVVDGAVGILLQPPALARPQTLVAPYGGIDEL